MTITEHTTIAEIAGALPSSVRVFQRHGIDFCCGGKKPIGIACEEQGLSFARLVEAIEAAGAEPVAEARDWAREPLRALVRHIVDAYHEPLREELPRLESMAFRVARAHGTGAPHLSRVETIVAELSDELLAHMQKEELVLFPAIEAAESGGRTPMPLASPVAVMEHEHDHAGALLAELREITGGYEVPEWGCGTFRALYTGLAELESAMHVHVHLENNVLFPRALALQKDDGSRTAES